MCCHTSTKIQEKAKKPKGENNTRCISEAKMQDKNEIPKIGKSRSSQIENIITHQNKSKHQTNIERNTKYSLRK